MRLRTCACPRAAMRRAWRDRRPRGRSAAERRGDRGCRCVRPMRRRAPRGGPDVLFAYSARRASSAGVPVDPVECLDVIGFLVAGLALLVVAFRVGLGLVAERRRDGRGARAGTEHTEEITPADLTTSRGRLVTLFHGRILLRFARVAALTTATRKLP